MFGSKAARNSTPAGRHPLFKGGYHLTPPSSGGAARIPLQPGERIEAKMSNFVVRQSWFGFYSRSFGFGLFILFLVMIVGLVGSAFGAGTNPSWVATVVGLLALGIGLIAWYPVYMYVSRERIRVWYVITSRRILVTDADCTRIEREFPLVPGVNASPLQGREIHRSYGSGGGIWKRGDVHLTAPGGATFLIADVSDPEHTAKLVQFLCGFRGDTPSASSPA